MLDTLKITLINITSLTAKQHFMKKFKTACITQREKK